MSGNPINVIGPNFFGGFPSLRYLYLENVVKMANLVIHEESLETNTDIQKLDLSNNFMLGIPFEIFKMNRAIEILNLAGNSLTTFPNLGYLKDLQYLDFSDNNLKILKSSYFKHNSKLKVLTSLIQFNFSITHVHYSVTFRITHIFCAPVFGFHHLVFFAYNTHFRITYLSVFSQRGV